MGWAEIISLAAFILALVLAIVQIRMMSLEMRPYLSFSNLEPALTVNKETGCADIDFTLRLENVGKCVLRYETTQFDVWINDLQLPNVQTTSTGSVVGVNTSTVYRRFYTEIWHYPTNPAPENYIAPNCKIIFAISYYRINKPTKKYSLSYEVVLESKGGVTRVLYGKTFAD